MRVTVVATREKPAELAHYEPFEKLVDEGRIGGDLTARDGGVDTPCS